MKHALFADLSDASKRRHIWGALAWNDILQRYRRSVIGPNWITISLAIFISAMGFLYSKLFKIDINHYVPFFATGYLIWTSLASTVTESCYVFVESEGIIKQIKVPLALFVIRLVWRNILIFVHSVPIVLLVLLIFPVKLTWATLLFFPGILIFFANLFWLALFLGLLSTRFRDVPLLVQNVLQIAFFATPIFWTKDLLGGHGYIADANPLYSLIEVARAPLLGQVPSLWNYGVAIGVTAAGWMLVIPLYARFRNRVPYWL